MQSDFTGMLQSIQGRFQHTEAPPCETVQALADTIASLQQIQKGLEETKEYRAAQAEKEMSAKCDRVLQLKKRVEESRAAAEELLGYPLKHEHCANGGAYKLMPVGYVSKEIFDANMQQFQRQIASTEERLDQYKGEVGDLKFRRSWQALDQKQLQLVQLEAQLHDMRSRLLGYMIAHQPMLNPTFSETLAVHLDNMLDAYLELRKLENAETKA